MTIIKIQLKIVYNFTKNLSTNNFLQIKLKTGFYVKQRLFPMNIYILKINHRY